MILIGLLLTLSILILSSLLQFCLEGSRQPVTSPISQEQSGRPWGARLLCPCLVLTLSLGFWKASTVLLVSCGNGILVPFLKGAPREKGLYFYSIIDSTKITILFKDSCPLLSTLRMPQVWGPVTARFGTGGSASEGEGTF